MTPKERSKISNSIAKLRSIEKRVEEGRRLRKEIARKLLDAITGSDKLTLRGVAKYSDIPFSQLVSWLYNHQDSMTSDSMRKLLRFLK